MKKFLLVLVVALIAVTSVFAAFDATKLSVGGGLGVEDRVVQAYGKGDYYRGRVDYMGMTLDVRADYKIHEDFDLTAILSVDVPVAATLKAKFDHYALFKKLGTINDATHFLGLYVGVSKDLLTKGAFTLNGSVGPEFAINLDDGKFDAFVTAVLKGAYAVSDKVTIDAALHGGIGVLMDGSFVKGSDDAAVVYTNNKVTVGATYKF